MTVAAPIYVDKRRRCAVTSAEGIPCELHEGHAFKHFGIVLNPSPARPIELHWSDENRVAKERR